MPPSALGAAGATAMAKACSALPAVLIAVAVTVAVPAANGVSLNRPSDSQRCTTPPGSAAAT